MLSIRLFLLVKYQQNTMAEKIAIADASLTTFKINLIPTRKHYRLSSSPKVNHMPHLLPSSLPPASHSNPKNKRISTEPTPESQYTSSDRQLSRFIFNHLQKKIEYEQEQKYRSLCKSDHLDSQPFCCYDSSEMERCSQTRPKGKLPYIFGYQKRKNQTASIRGDQLMRIQKKQKLRMKNCYRNSLINPGSRRQKANSTHIDSYFDLSCLRNVKKQFCKLIPHEHSQFHVNFKNQK